MGRTAIVETKNGMTIQLTSPRNAPISLEHMHCCGLDPSSFDLLVAKGVVSPVAAFHEVFPTLIRMNTLGSISADMTSFDCRHRRHTVVSIQITVMAHQMVLFHAVPDSRTMLAMSSGSRAARCGRLR